MNPKFPKRIYVLYNEIYKYYGHPVYKTRENKIVKKEWMDM